jgi:signal peptidase I
MATSPVNRAVANRLWVQLCQAKGAGWLPVLSESMLPLIRPGDLVEVARVAPGQVRFGDIVVFRSGDDLVVHRVFDKRLTPDGLCFLQKGDAGCAYGLVTADKIVGRVTGLKKGTRTYDLSSPPGRLANLVMSAWLRLAAAGANHLKPSHRPAVFRAGGALPRALNFATGLLVIVCSAVWLPAALVRRHGKPAD